jgi:hypothetical protein
MAEFPFLPGPVSDTLGAGQWVIAFQRRGCLQGGVASSLGLLLFRFQAVTFVPPSFSCSGSVADDAPRIRPLFGFTVESHCAHFFPVFSGFINRRVQHRAYS